TVRLPPQSGQTRRVTLSLPSSQPGGSAGIQPSWSGVSPKPYQLRRSRSSISLSGRRARPDARESDAAAKLSVDHDALVGLREGEPLLLAELGRALAHATLHGGHVLDLARVARERLHLEIDGVRNVDDEVGAVPPHHVHFLDPVRLEALGHQLRER